MMTKAETLNIMKSAGRKDALDLVSRLPDMTDTEVINEENKVPDWDGSKDYSSYAVGFAVGYTIDGERQIFGLLQPHNAAHYPSANPDNTRSLWSLKHTTNPLKAKPFVPAQGTSGMYLKGECYKDDEDIVYICTVEQTNYSYAEYPDHWEIWDGTTK